MIIIFDHVCTFLPLCPLLFIIIPYSFPICDSIDTRNLNGPHGHLGIQGSFYGRVTDPDFKKSISTRKPVASSHPRCVHWHSEDLWGTCEHMWKHLRIISSWDQFISRIFGSTKWSIWSICLFQLHAFYSDLSTWLWHGVVDFGGRKTCALRALFWLRCVRAMSDAIAAKGGRLLVPTPKHGRSQRVVAESDDFKIPWITADHWV